MLMASVSRYFHSASCVPMQPVPGIAPGAAPDSSGAFSTRDGAARPTEVPRWPILDAAITETSMASNKILIAQGGGPTAVINQSLVGAVLGARRFPDIGFVYGARHGVRGIVNEDLVDLAPEATDNPDRGAAPPPPPHAAPLATPGAPAS